MCRWITISIRAFEQSHLSCNTSITHRETRTLTAKTRRIRKLLCPTAVNSSLTRCFLSLPAFVVGCYWTKTTWLPITLETKRTSHSFCYHCRSRMLLIELVRQTSGAGWCNSILRPNPPSESMGLGDTETGGVVTHLTLITVNGWKSRTWGAWEGSTCAGLVGCWGHREVSGGGGESWKPWYLEGQPFKIAV